MSRKNVEKSTPIDEDVAIPIRDEGIMSEEEDVPDLTELAREITPGKSEEKDAELERLYFAMRQISDADIRRASEPKPPTWTKRHAPKILGLVASFGIGFGIHHELERRTRLQKELAVAKAELARRDAELAAEEATQRLEFALRLRSAVVRHKLGLAVDYFLKTPVESVAQPEPIVGGFDALRIPDETVRSIVFDTFPESWAQENIEGIEFTGEAFTAPSQYGLEVIESGKKVPCPAIAIAVEIPETQRTYIKFGVAAQGMGLDFIFNRAIAHEIAHATDPFTISGLEPDRRLHYIERLVLRVESPNRTRFEDYTEKIQNPDLKVQLLFRVKEYWGQIFDVYLSDPKNAHNTLKPKDIQLIEDYLHETAPDFDPHAAAKDRKNLVFSIDQEGKESIITIALAMVLPKERFKKVRPLIHWKLQDVDKYTPEQKLERARWMREALDKKTASLPEEWLGAEEAWLWFWMQIETVREMAYDVDDVHEFQKLFEEAIPKLENHILAFDTALNNLDEAEARRARRVFADMDDIVVTYAEASSSGLFARMMTDMFPKL